jgi:phenylalanyl-tRNA synthetase alpha chain
MLQNQIEELKNQAMEEIKNATGERELFDVEKKYVGRKGSLTEILKSLKDLSAEEKREVGPVANQSRTEIENLIAETRKNLGNKIDFEAEKIDISIPARKLKRGHLHILSQVQNEIEDIFASMGFGIVEGLEVETEHYDFDALNIPKDHPARDMQDTFWIKNENDKKERILMRTQTSPMQVRYMEQHVPPLRIIVPGKCFRREATDSTHDHTFYQFEALVVDKNINVGNLKYVAEQFFSKFFKKDVKVRLRPSYFPFVEPGFEFDISCLVCSGKGCRACKGGGWLELGGAGMVNQSVFESAGYPGNQYQGFAWGFGLERLAMMKYKINDIRLFHSGDLRFINQF